MTHYEQKEKLMQAVIERKPNWKLWADYVKMMSHSLDIQQNKHDVRTDFIRLILPELRENPTMISVLRSDWNEVAIELNMPDQVVG